MSGFSQIVCREIHSVILIKKNPTASASSTITMMSSNKIKMTIQLIKWNPIVVEIHKSIDKVRERTQITA
jgi:hypothetical protein